MHYDCKLYCYWKGNVIVIIVSKLCKSNVFQYNIEGNVSVRSHMKRNVIDILL